jgi:hypothetical protein
MKKEERPRFELKLDWQIPTEWQTTKYSTNFTMQYTGAEYILGFFEAQAPVLLGTREEVSKAAQDIGVVPARCQARITLSPGRLVELAGMILHNMDDDDLAKVLNGVQRARGLGE